jgi:hypothetical protein
MATISGQETPALVVVVSLTELDHRLAMEMETEMATTLEVETVPMAMVTEMEMVTRMESKFWIFRTRQTLIYWLSSAETRSAMATISGQETPALVVVVSLTEMDHRLAMEMETEMATTCKSESQPLNQTWLILCALVAAETVAT